MKRFNISKPKQFDTTKMKYFYISKSLRNLCSCQKCGYKTILFEVKRK